MSGTLALATSIAAMDREALERLVARRRPQAPNSVLDPIGLAAELLRPDSIARAIAPLDRSALALLGDAAPLPDGAGDADGTGDAGGAGDADDAAARVAALTALGLLGAEGAPGPEGAPRASGTASSRTRPARLPEVVAAVREALAERAAPAPAPAGGGADDGGAGAEGAAAGGGSPAAADPADTDAWFAAGLTAVGQAAECLRLLRERPGRLNRNRTVAVATVRAAAEHTGVAPEDVALAFGLLQRAGLAAPVAEEATLVVSARSEGWLALPHGARWLALADSLAAGLAPQLRALLGVLPDPGSDLAAAAARLPVEYPLLPDADRSAVAAFVAAAEYAGATVGGVLCPAFERLLAGDREAAGAIVAAQMPPAAPGVYVQPDLSVVVPGPLAPEDEADLAAVTRPEHIGVASTRRIADASVAEALDRGRSAAEVRGIFTRLSLTGIPQPLDYLLDALAERVGSIVVAEHTGDEGRTSITVSRLDLADTLLVDRALQHLQLHRRSPTGTRLFSRLRSEHVAAALADARYHASGASADRAPAPPASPSDAAPGAPGPSDPDALPAPLGALVERVYLAARSEPGSADFTRRLELAIRDRSPVLVTAEARGQRHTFTLLPVSVNGGRLRATDQSAGVERTLPVSVITAVESV
ncbi:helicase-associated domain-containing protein [Leucobacter allii]|uniref:helicase-associated domain-containing protein n=1 Tax=Leucobacter allii TaxID=2932247 RepID=UPI001FD46AFD|nr:helicase-associated domain-containing protein [Leucobacter allii]UOR00850.1 helicase-associated domain-containing protein [Leucobacter allii]